jgi:transcriptional regulator with XRE-family HTH domain
MICNERQRRVSSSQRSRLLEELSEIEKQVAPAWVKEATRAAINSQILDLDGELAEYAALQARGSASVTEVADLADLPRALIRARITSGLTQRELASRLGLHEQQIQRYEANEYAGANIARLQEVMQALDVTFGGELSLPASAGNGAALRRNLRGLGLSRDTLSRRFFGSSSSAPPTAGWMNAAARASRIFGADIADAVAGNIPQLAGAGAFRAGRAANRQALNGYARYAEYLAKLLLAVGPAVHRPLPPLVDLREQLKSALETEPLEALVRTSWEHGIPVLPLLDPGTFYGACWFFDERPVVALKNSFRSPDRWAFLLAHELKHAQGPTQNSVLEDDLPVRDWRELPAERAADDYAAGLLLGPDAEAMVRVAVQRADGQVARLREVVPLVAAAGNVSVGLFADHMAARMQMQGVNWWPTANRLHPENQDAWQIVRNVLFEYVDLTRLDSLDRDILVDGIGL